MNLKFLNIIFFLVTGLFCQLPLFEKENLAKQYYNSKFYDDAIIVYEEILNEKINILGSDNINLKNELITLSELYYLINDLERSKHYLYELINIQSKYILDSQNNYLEPLYILKEIYSQEKNFNNVFLRKKHYTLIIQKIEGHLEDAENKLAQKNVDMKKLDKENEMEIL